MELVKVGNTLTEFLRISCIIYIHETCYELYIGQQNETLIKKSSTNIQLVHIFSKWDTFDLESVFLLS